MRISSLYICLPLLAALGPFASAGAGMAPADATSLLAKTLALDKRCNILSADSRQELQDFVARAEIALAEMQSVQVARAALAKGRASGKVGDCGPEQARLVNEVLDEARKGAGASAQSPVEVEASADPAITPKQEVAVLTTADEPLKKPKPKPAKKPLLAKLDGQKPTMLQKPVKAPKKLSQYAGLAQKYYLARRCNTMGTAAIQRLYGTVLSSHRQAMASNSALSVKAMLRAVEAKAGSQSCS